MSITCVVVIIKYAVSMRLSGLRGYITSQEIEANGARQVNLRCGGGFVQALSPDLASALVFVRALVLVRALALAQALVSG